MMEAPTLDTAVPGVVATTAAPEAPQTQTAERPPITDKRTLRLFYNPPGTLRLTVEPKGDDGWEGYSYQTVRLYQAAPLSDPGRYIALQNGKGEEITMLERLDYFAPESRPIAEEEIRRRYLTAKVLAVTGIKTEFGITYWNVATDKGERDFVVQSLSESCIWLSDRHLLLIDADGNRFEIADRTALDPVSQERLATVL